MGRLAQEALGCQAEVLCGGLGSPNRDRVLQHIVAGHPLLIPYPRVREGARLGWGSGRRGRVSRGHPAALTLTAVQLRRGLQPRAVSEEGPQGPLGCERRWVPLPLPWTLTVSLPDPQSPLLTCSPSCPSTVLQAGARVGLPLSLQGPGRQQVLQHLSIRVFPKQETQHRGGSNWTANLARTLPGSVTRGLQVPIWK